MVLSDPAGWLGALVSLRTHLRGLFDLHHVSLLPKSKVDMWRDPEEHGDCSFGIGWFSGDRWKLCPLPGLYTF